MEYNIKLTQQEAHILQMGLGELPLKVGINLLGKLTSQIKEQDEANAVPLSLLDS